MLNRVRRYYIYDKRRFIAFLTILLFILLGVYLLAFTPGRQNGEAIVVPPPAKEDAPTYIAPRLA